jgi:hypothetical protein
MRLWVAGFRGNTTNMQKNKTTSDGRKKYVQSLMEHRKIDVQDFIDKVHAELISWNDWDDQEERKFDHWFSELRDNLDDTDCAIMDVLLAKNIEDAKSIAGGFQATCKEAVN